MYRHVIAVGALAGALVVLTEPASAQALADGTLAFTPAAHEVPIGTGPYDAKGLPIGGFRLFPTVLLAPSYDSNVFRTENFARDSLFFQENPNVTLQSDWAVHELDIYGGLDSFQYTGLSSDQRSPDHTDYDVGADGRLDILRGLFFSAGGAYAIQHEAFATPDQPGNVKDPTQFANSSAYASLTYHPYKFGLTVGGTFAHFAYDPTTIIGGSPVSNTDRNQDAYTAYAKASYEFSPGYAAYLEATDNNNDYDLTFDRNGYRRNNHGYDVDFGLDMLVTDLVKGEVFAGYLNQHYNAPLPNVSGFNYGAKLDWNASPFWTFHLLASRTLNGTDLAGASTEDDQAVQLSVDYLIRQNITITVTGSYLDAKYAGSPRDDTYPAVSARLTYNLNRWMSLYASEAYQSRNSSIVDQNFGDNVVSIGLQLKE
jgi:hypothetical protein